MRIIVAAGGVQQPATRDEAALGHALLPDNGEFRVGHDLIRIGMEIALDAVNPYTLVHVTRNYPVVISLLCQIHIMGIGGTVTEEHGPPDIAFNRILVGRERKEQFVEPSDMLPCFHRAVLLQVL